jgi:hypothetical protein
VTDIQESDDSISRKFITTTTHSTTFSQFLSFVILQEQEFQKESSIINSEVANMLSAEHVRDDTIMTTPDDPE